VHIQDLCGNSSHFCHFLRNESRPAESASLILFRRIDLASGYGEGIIPHR
jgi:hypothetical protein